MGRKRKYDIYFADFETTAHKNNTETEVWLSCVVKSKTSDYKFFNSIEDTYKYFLDLKANIIVYYHNLSFDGSFWLDFFFRQGKRAAFKKYNSSVQNFGQWKKDEELLNGEFTAEINVDGSFYVITLKANNYIIKMFDSLKLLPTTISSLGEALGQRKLEIDYNAEHKVGEIVQQSDKEYIKRDVEILKYSLERFFEEHTRAKTIGIVSFNEWRNSFKMRFWDFDNYFPKIANFSNSECDFEKACRSAYKSGWVYIKNKGKLIKNGITIDNNSLYPYVMLSESGNKYPYGKPHFVKDTPPKNCYYFIHVEADFELKPNHLPFLQIKGNVRFSATKNVITTFIDYNGKKFDKYQTELGTRETAVDLWLTQTDWELVQEQYDVFNLKILGYICFNQIAGLFDDYILKYKAKKESDTGAQRLVDKFLLNTLSGKFGTSDIADYKVPYYDNENKIVRYFTVLNNDEDRLVYVPIAAAVTAYGRALTVRAAQANYKYFQYADTDSLHLNCETFDLKGIHLDDSKFGCWKVENKWDKAIYACKKTYIEQNNDEIIIKGAGMTQRCKDVLCESILQTGNFEFKSNAEKEFCKVKRELTDFKVGIEIPSVLKSKIVKGGCILEDTTYRMWGL